MKEQEIFHQVLLLPHEDRSVFLDQVCAGNPALRTSVAALLQAHYAASSFLERPPTALDGTIETPGVDAAPGTVVAGRYKLLEQIGEGGMGTVWVAEQIEPVKRRVALKLVKTGMDSKSVLARFEAERQALALMDHQNIARVHDGGVTDHGRPFFVMELVKGMPLTEYCDARRLSIRERLELFVPICQAVQHAHQKGIIHRDLKPSNILVTENDGRPVPKVIDFGLAKALSAATTLTERTLHTAFGAVMGTPLYMAPEQVAVNALDVDTRSDVYSLGVILYELLTGTTPLEKQRFKEAAWDEIRRVIREEEPPRPSARLSDSHASLPSISAQRHTEPAALTRLVRGELDWIVMKALEKDRNRRYETANGFSMDVQRFLADEAVHACPPSTAYRFRKFVRRNKAAVVAVAVVVVTLLGGIVGTSLGFIRAENARVAESAERASAENARDHAWNALDAMTSAVTGESLATQKEVTPEQKRFLRSALDSYRGLAEGKANDEKSRARTAGAARRVGHIELVLGEFPRSGQSFQSAAESFAALSAEFPENQNYRRSWSLCLSDTGFALSQMGRPAEAKPVFEQSIAITQRLATEHPEDYRYRSDSAVRLLLFASCLRRLDRTDDAVKSLNEAKNLLERLIEEGKEIEHHRVILAECHSDIGNAALKRLDDRVAERHFRRAIELFELSDRHREGSPLASLSMSDYYHNLGLVLCRTGRREEGLQRLRRAVDIQRVQVEKYPSRPEIRQNLARAIMSLAIHCSDRREAMKLTQSAIDVMERLVKDHPEAEDHPIYLAGLCCNLGNLLRRESRIPESIAEFDKAVALLDKHRALRAATAQSTDFLGKTLNGRALSKEQALQWLSAAGDHRRVLALVSPDEAPKIRLDVALCLAKAGRAEEAVGELGIVGDDRRLAMFDLFTRARIHAMLSTLMPNRRGEFADAAVAGLGKALRGGLSRPKSRLDDGDFTSLRDRDDFKKLVREFSEPKAKESESPKR